MFFAAAIIDVFKIPYYKAECKTAAKFHGMHSSLPFCSIIITPTVTIGHETVMAKTTFFASTTFGDFAEKGFFDHEFVYQDMLLESGAIQSHVRADTMTSTQQFALLQFDKPVVSSPHSRIIGSRLDSDVFSSVCRIAFHGTLVNCITEKDYEARILPQLKIFKVKKKEGIVERVCKEWLSNTLKKINT